MINQNRDNLNNIEEDDTQSAINDYFRMMYDSTLTKLQRNHAASQYHRLRGLARMSSDFTGSRPDQEQV